MSTLTIDLYGYSLPSGHFEIVVGETTLDCFNDFLQGRFVWAVSGVNWQKSDAIKTVKIEDRAQLYKYMKDAVQSCGLVGYYTLWVDVYDGISVSGDVLELCKLVQYFDEHPSLPSTDYWIFSKEADRMIEIYHEDIITVGKSTIPSS
jgi:hypothetical protein